MKASRLILAALLVPLVLASFSGIAGAQSAQQNTLSITCSGGANQIQPLGAPGTWTCTALLNYAGGIQLTEPVNPAIINFDSPDAQSWMNVIIAPNSIAFPYEQGTSVTRTFTVSVALTQDAPAFQTQRVTINPSVAAQPRDPVVTVTAQPTQLAITPGYFNLYNVRLDTKIGREGPQSAVTYPIVIDNFSNGDTRFEFFLATENPPAGFQPVVPEPVVLQSRATGGKTTQGQVSFQVYTPYRNGYVNDIGAMQLRVDSFYAPNTNIKGASSTVSTLTQARGFYVPGAEAPLVALGIVGAAVGMAALRRED